MYKRNEKENKATQGEGEVQVLQVSNRTSDYCYRVNTNLVSLFWTTDCFALLRIDKHGSSYQE